jgi:hypothetical protein
MSSVTDTRHYRERLADEAVSRVRRKLPTMLPQVLSEQQTYTVLRLMHAAVTTAVDELDQRELWRTD